MATREEIIAGLEFTVEQARRTTSGFAPEEWDEKRSMGWTPKELYAHLAATAAIVPTFSQGMAAMPEDRDMTAGLDINQMNETAVSGMRSMTPEQVMQAFEANYTKLIDFVKGLPDEQLSLKRRFGPVPMPVSDIIANVVMLHGIHHVYEANDRLEI